MYTNTFKNDIIDAMLGSSASLIGATPQLALSTTDPGADGAGITEPSGGAYSRVTLDNNDAFWSIASDGQKVSLLDVTFPTADGAAWGELAYWAIYDAGVMKLYGAFYNGAVPTTIEVNDGDTFRIPAGDLRATVG